MNSFLIYIGIVVFMASIVAIPVLTSGCKTEECFKAKYKTIEVVATLKSLSTRARTSTGEYTYEVNGKSYYTYRDPLDNFDQIGDQFYLLCDTLDPSNSFLTWRFYIPDNLVNLNGNISYYGTTERYNHVGIVLEYYANDYKIERKQYFPIEKAEIIEKLYKEKREVVIGVAPENVRRGYLNIEESLK